VCGNPETGACDQYIPEAGAGRTSGAVLGSGKGGKGMYGPRDRTVETIRWGAGEGALDGVLGAMADVERRFRGRLTSLVGRGSTKVDEDDIVPVPDPDPVVGGERGFSCRGVSLPLLCVEGGFEEDVLEEDVGESLWL